MKFQYFSQNKRKAVYANRDSVVITSQITEVPDCVNVSNSFLVK